MSHLADTLASFAARLASVLGPAGMRVVARINKYVTNPLLRRWAARVRYMAVIEHRGRKSGRRFATPVMAFVDAGAITVVLNYGVESDWIRNVMTAGAAAVVHRRQRYAMTDPRIVSIGSDEVPPGVRDIGDASRRALRATLIPK